MKSRPSRLLPHAWRMLSVALLSLHEGLPGLSSGRRLRLPLAALPIPSFPSASPALQNGATLKKEEEKPRLTRRQALPQLVGLVGIVDDERVEVARAAHLELGLQRAGLERLLDARR